MLSAAADERGASLPPALLADGTWWGTLAAARDLGARGVSVTVATAAAVTPARWSRHVARTVSYPGTGDADRLLAWLLDYGRRTPGHVLYPTSDEMAWLVAAEAGALGRDFRLLAPPLDSLACLLDKAQLARAAAESGLSVPQAWCPSDEAELDAVAAEAHFPVYVKPRTQVFAATHGKGERVERPEDLAPAWRRWRALARYPLALRLAIPGIERPLVQASLGKPERVFTVDGWVSRVGFGAWRTLGCVKVLQRPRGSGPGICFEAAPVPPELDRGLCRLFSSAGFEGVFDAEFIQADGRWQLIDVNPRFYNHMAFEIERGLPLPWLAYLGALGDEERLCGALSQALEGGASPRAYVHHLPVRLVLAGQAASGGMSRAQRHGWRRWEADHGGHATDPARQAGDPGPALAEVVMELQAAARHPRSWLRTLARG